MAKYKVYNYEMPKSTYTPTTYSDKSGAYANEIAQAKNNLQQTLNNKPSNYVSPYQNRINSLINQMQGRKFSYDLTGDALYNQYKDQYTQLGKQAMQDTIGQASALTGGYGNSYAATVGNQAYQGYLGKLNDKIPELYQLALQKYQIEGDDLNNLYGLYANEEASAYGKHRDKVNDYQADRSYYDTALNNLRSMNQSLWSQDETNRYNANNQDWNNYWTAEQRTQDNYRQAVAEDQWNADFAEKQRQFNENFAENQRQFNENQALSREQAAQKLVANASSGSSSGSKSNGSTNSAKTGGQANTEYIKNFNSSILLPTEFARRGKKAIVNGKDIRFDDYGQYVSAVMEKWYKEGRLTANEVSYLKGQYNIK